MNQFIKNAALVMASVFTLSTTHSMAATNIDGGKNEATKTEVSKAEANTKAVANTSFKTDFRNADVIEAKTKTNFTEVNFALNGQIMTAFYAIDGHLLAVTRNLVSSQLPVSLLMNFKKHYSDYWITDLFELSRDSESTYYLTLENSETKTILRSNGETWETYSTTRK